MHERSILPGYVPDVEFGFTIVSHRLYPPRPLPPRAPLFFPSNFEDFTLNKKKSTILILRVAREPKGVSNGPKNVYICVCKKVIATVGKRFFPHHKYVWRYFVSIILHAKFVRLKRQGKIPGIGVIATTIVNFLLPLSVLFVLPILKCALF